MELDAETGDGLAGGGDAVDYFLSPALFDSNDDNRRDIRIAAGANQSAEVELQIGAELQPAVRMRNSQRSLDVVGHGLGCRVRQVIHGQNHDVIANPHTAVLATVTPEFRLHGHHRLVLMLWT